MTDALREPLQECEAAAAVAAARVDRLLGEIFEDGNRARRITRTMLKTHGLETTLEILTNTDSLRRAWLFGATRDSFLLLHKRRDISRPLEELPQALRDHQALVERMADLRQARRTLLEQADMERLLARTARRRRTDRDRARE